MAQRAEKFDARREMLEVLLTRLQRDRFPSVTMMNMIEGLLEPDERPIYAQMLVQKIRSDPHPSYPMMQRVLAQG